MVHGQLWEVIGGWATGGIMVRDGKDTESPSIGRLLAGSLVRELELSYNRLHYERLSGDGPDSGWVSVELSNSRCSRMLLVPISAGLVVLHGATYSGETFLALLQSLSAGDFSQDMRRHGITVVVPSSPCVPYTLFKDKPTEVWFDRVAMKYEAPEDRLGVQRSLDQIDGEISKLVSFGIPPERILGHPAEMWYRCGWNVHGWLHGIACLLWRRTVCGQSGSMCVSVLLPARAQLPRRSGGGSLLDSWFAARTTSVHGSWRHRFDR
eukprot:gnl/TRDRNA2_/TRDRNA2_141522_c1_seq2.p1 gnl/TRDRNA2_/TRDRNA2_141522_c1~~gnl/TRDRNA2_/TRDRNA2_141522_c1_seq2.p1  ORF type:complete len:266 (-),score=24.99 gnl/TRDRNA2_/TRDRNA2_141522_c1_seq2:180-977(-)